MAVLKFSRPIYVTVNSKTAVIEHDGSKVPELTQDFIDFLDHYFISRFEQSVKIYHYKDKIEDHIKQHIDAGCVHFPFQVEIASMPHGGSLVEVTLEGEHYDFIELSTFAENDQVLLEAVSF